MVRGGRWIDIRGSDRIFRIFGYFSMGIEFVRIFMHFDSGSSVFNSSSIIFQILVFEEKNQLLSSFC